MTKRYPSNKELVTLARQNGIEHPTPEMLFVMRKVYRYGRADGTRNKVDPKALHRDNVADLESARKATTHRAYSSAQVVFHVVPWGWQVDLTVLPKKGEPLEGHVCRDWGDDKQSAQRFLEQLIKMGQTGEADSGKMVR